MEFSCHIVTGQDLTRFADWECRHCQAVTIHALFLLEVVELAQQVFPAGLVQTLGGDDKLGPSLVDHPDIHKISFTESIATGKRIMQAAAKTLKRVTLEVSHSPSELTESFLTQANPAGW